MITATADYTTSALKNYRDPRARVRVHWVDLAAESTAVVASNDENRGAILTQVNDGITATTYKWMHCSPAGHTNRPILNGSCHPMPSDLVSGQVGWFSETTSDASGQWVTDPYITLTFTSRALIEPTITIQCDTQCNEYPTEFTINLYNGVTLEYTYYTNSNTDTLIEISLSGQSFSSITKFELIVSTWSAAYGIVKINEISLVSAVTYKGSDIVALDILEEIETEGGSLPLGNISSNEINLSLLNTDDRFTYGNTNSVFNNLLRVGVKIEVWIGFVLPSDSPDVSSGYYIVETENGDKVGYQPYGTYWSDDWVTNRRTLIVQTFARDRMEQLRNAEFDESLLYQNTSLYDLAEIVMNSASAKVTDNLQWEINAALADTVIPMAYFERMSYFQAIKYIVIAGLTTAYVNRNGIVIIGTDI